jgi:tetratricopeptide (TPR) repeat protein
MSFDTQTFQRLIEVRRFAEATRQLSEHARVEPGDPEIPRRLGQIAYLKDEYPAAERELKRALELDPQDEFARYFLFWTYAEQQRNAEAEEVALALIEEDPDHAEYYAIYAHLMLRTLHLDKAAALAKRALELDPTLRRARLVRVLLQKIAGDQRAAHGEIAELFGSDPLDRQLAAEAVDALMEQHRYREALSLGQDLLRSWPDHPSLVNILIEAKVASHPLSLPAWPFRKWGWPFSFGMWAVVIAGLRLVPRPMPGWVGGLALGYLLWVIHSWVHAPLLRKYYRSRGLR